MSCCQNTCNGKRAVTRQQKVAKLKYWRHGGTGLKTASKTRGVKKWSVFIQWQVHKTAWHKAAERCQAENLGKLWDWANELQLETVVEVWGVVKCRFWANALEHGTFTQDERDFLEQYCLLNQVLKFFKPEDPFCVTNNAEAEREAEQKFRNFKLDNEKFAVQMLARCTQWFLRWSRLFKPSIKRAHKDQIIIIRDAKIGSYCWTIIRTP